MRSKEKVVLKSLSEKIELLCDEQSSRQLVVYEMFTKLENKINILEHQIISLEKQIRELEEKVYDIVPERRDCYSCTIS